MSSKAAWRNWQIWFPLAWLAPPNQVWSVAGSDGLCDVATGWPLPVVLPSCVTSLATTVSLPAFALNLLCAVPQAIFIAWLTGRLWSRKKDPFVQTMFIFLWVSAIASGMAFFFLGETTTVWDLSLLEGRAIESWWPIPGLSLVQLALVFLAGVNHLAGLGREADGA